MLMALIVLAVPILMAIETVVRVIIRYISDRRTHAARYPES